MIALARDEPSGLPGGGWGFWLPAEAIEPDDLAWPTASKTLKARFWAEARRVAHQHWDRSRALGLDRFGNKLVPLHPLTLQARQDDVNPVSARKPYSPMGRASPAAPPLTSVGAASRLRRYLRHTTIQGQGAWFYWIFDRQTRRYWGEILARHARGFSQHFRYPARGWGYVKPRDVLGFSDAELLAVKRHMEGWWSARRPAVEAAATIAAHARGETLRARPEPMRERTAAILARVRSSGEMAVRPQPPARATSMSGLKDFTFASGDQKSFERRLAGKDGSWTTGFRLLGQRQPGGPFGGGAASPRPVTPRLPRPAKAMARVEETADYARKKTSLPSIESFAVFPESQFGRRMRWAAKAIDRVHGVKGLPAITVDDATQGRNFGEFRIDRNGAPRSIGVRQDGPSPEFTFIHEAGHWLYSGVLGRTKDRRDVVPIEANNGFTKWKAAVEASQSYRGLQDLLAPQRRAGLRLPVSEDRLNYLLSWNEVWARSYVQFITARTGDVVLLRRLARNLEDQVTGQGHWQEEDFRRIEYEIAVVLGKKGWIR